MAKANTIRWTITAACGGVALAHALWPKFALDSTYTILLVVAVIPWLAPVIKSIELPGGFKIEVKDLKEATEKVTAPVTTANMISFTNEAPRPKPTSKPTDVFAFISEIASTDHSLALVAFRIEVERRLVLLAQKHQIDTQRRGVGQLLRELQKRELIPVSVASGLSELIALGNQAAHGAKVSNEAVLWMLDVGPEVLRILDKLAADLGE